MIEEDQENVEIFDNKIISLKIKWEPYFNYIVPI